MRIWERIDELAEKVGGRLRASALLQKRATQLCRGAQPLVRSNETEPILIAAQEILAGAIGFQDGGQERGPFTDLLTRQEVRTPQVSASLGMTAPRKAPTRQQVAANHRVPTSPKGRGRPQSSKSTAGKVGRHVVGA